MKTRDYITFFIGGILISFITLFTRRYTGYMDADYYFTTAREIASGNGFFQNFLWNYLDNPVGIPHPAFTYWMPLSSIIASIGLFITQSNEFVYARIPFVLIYGLVPVLIAHITFRVTEQRLTAWLAAFLSIFCGFYLRYISEPDSFGISMLLGTLIIFLSTLKFSGWRKWTVPILLGVFAGLMHMSRADGILWLVISVVGLFASQLAGSKHIFLEIFKKPISKDVLIPIALALAGYLIISTPWYLRNFELFNSIFPPGNSKTLFLIEYDQLFSYPASHITFSVWWHNGFGEILKNVVSALGTNLITSLVVQGNIVMLPLAIIGVQKSWKSPIAKMTTFTWILIFFSMSVFFPFAGRRGGFLHSGAALQPLIWMYAAIGLRIAINKGIEYRNWDRKSANLVFNGFFLAIAIFVSVYIFRGDVKNQYTSSGGMLWSNYKSVDEYINGKYGGKDFRVMVNNPAAYNAATMRQAIVLPYGDLEEMKTAALDFEIDYLILDNNLIATYHNLFYESGDVDGLDYLGKISEFQIYRFVRQ
jgi:hypothetical protein